MAHPSTQTAADPARERWLAFLCGTDAWDSERSLWRGWVVPGASAQPPGYEEATAWVLLAASMLDADPPGWAERVSRAAERLAELAVSHRALRRDGRRWLFDTGVGLLALHRLGGFDAATNALAGGMDELLGAGLAVDGGPPLGDETARTRWSEAFGAHLLWLVLPLRALGRHAEAEKLVDSLLPRFVRRSRREDGGVDEWLAVHAASDRCYTHGACYGLRGLLSSDDARQVHVGRRCVETLLRACRADGVAPAWTSVTGSAPAGSPEPAAPPIDGPALRADATLQLHALADTAFGGRPPAGLHVRAATALPLPVGDAGGVRYGVDGGDVSAGHQNVWATAFALMTASSARRAPC